MFENQSWIWIVAILFVVLNCNSCLEDKCDSHSKCGCGTPTTGLTPILLVAIVFLLFNNNNSFCC